MWICGVSLSAILESFITKIHLFSSYVLEHWAPEKALLPSQDLLKKKPQDSWAHKAWELHISEANIFPGLCENCRGLWWCFFLKKARGWIHGAGRGPPLIHVKSFFFGANLGFREYSRISPFFFRSFTHLGERRPEFTQPTMQKSRCKKTPPRTAVFFPLATMAPAHGRRSSDKDILVDVRVLPGSFFWSKFLWQKTCRLP